MLKSVLLQEHLQDAQTNKYIPVIKINESTMKKINDENYENAISSIANQTKSITEFWSNSRGWAPAEAGDLLLESRLTRLLTLTCCLCTQNRNYPDQEDEGQLLLAWVNLGAVVEGILKTFLAAFVLDYTKNPVIDKNGQAVALTSLGLDDLRKFYKSKNLLLCESHLDWIAHIQKNRNAIHIYTDKKLWTWDQFRRDLIEYRHVLQKINESLPYPENYNY